MWQAKDKRELAIEVWEKLDCESIGSAEIEAIEEVVRDVYGESAVESPMRIARMLADEGAVLRHSELMGLFVSRYEAKPYTAEFRNIFRLGELSHALSSIRRLENLRKKFLADGDKEGLRLIKERTIQARKALGSTPDDREIWQWLGIWLTTPDVFETWLSLRRRTPEFNELFGDKLDR
jgi:hypothetical protein